MARTEPLPLPDLPAHVSRALTEFIGAAQTVFSTDLRSIILFGSAAEGRLRATSDVNLLLVLSQFDHARASDLRNPLRIAQAAVRLSPMFILAAELPAAIAVFPDKFADILRRRKVLHGSDPFVGVSIPRAILIARLDQVLLNLILRLREVYLTRGLRQEQLILPIAEAAAPLRSSAAALLELQGRSFSSPKAALEILLRESAKPSWLEAHEQVSRAREQAVLPSGVADHCLLQLIAIAQSLRARLAALGEAAQ